MTQGPVLSIPTEEIPSLRKRMAKKLVTSASGCIEWTGAMSVDGYGMTRVTIDGKARSISAHRASWMIDKGPIQRGLVVDHLCRIRKCVNVEHLEPITANENTARGILSRRILPPVEKRPAWVDAKLWLPAKAKAEVEGTNLSDVLRDALRAYVGIDNDNKEKQ